MSKFLCDGNGLLPVLETPARKSKKRSKADEKR